MKDSNSKFWVKLILATLALACCIGLAFLCAGCRSENTGVSAAVGDITTLPEISDASDDVSIKVLYLMTGARVWTAKDSNVKVEYRNVYTNDYIGIFHTRGQQDLAVTVEPVATYVEQPDEEPVTSNIVETATVTQ